MAARCSFAHINRHLAINALLTPDLQPKSVHAESVPLVLCRVAVSTSQRSSERFWMASATTVRSMAMTERGSSLPITALPDTIMLAPACDQKCKFTLKKKHKNEFEFQMGVLMALTSAHL